MITVTHGAYIYVSLLTLPHFVHEPMILCRHILLVKSVITNVNVFNV